MLKNVGITYPSNSDIKIQYKIDNNLGKNYEIIKKKPKYLNTNLELCIKAGLLGVLRGSFGLLLEHPLDSIKTQWQANIFITKSSEMVRFIYIEKGLLGFYRGFVPNLIRTTSKNLYRWPLIIFLPNFFEKTNLIFFESLKNLEGLCKIQTGLMIANIEILLICPLDRLKTYFMTHSVINNKSYSFLKHFYITNRGNIINQLYQGLEPTFYRSNISWISFLYLEYKTKYFLRKIKNSDDLKFADLILLSILVGSGNLLLSKSFF